ncbi:MAG: hypothetical protein ABL869_12070 [Candidatus Nitrotoga sp.]
MPDTKTSAELSASTLTGAELIRVVQGGSDRKTTLSAVVADLGLTGGGGGGGAPTTAEYIVNTANAGLSAARVVTDNSVIAKDVSVAGQISYTLVDGGIATAKLAANAVGNARLAKMAANTVKVNNTNASADPADLALPINTLLGRGPTGDIIPVTMGTNMSISAGGALTSAGGGGGSGNVTYDGTVFKDGSGSTIYFSNGEYTWATKPAASTLPRNVHIAINPSSFGGTHKHTVGPTCVSDATRLMPAGGIQLLCRGSGSVAAPLGTASGTSATAFNIPAHFSLPASFFEYAGGGLLVKGRFQKTGASAAASVFSIRIGELATGNNDAIASLTTNATAGIQARIDEHMRIVTLGGDNVATFVSGLQVPNLGNATTGPTDKNSGTFNTTSVMYIVPTAHCATDAAATHALIEYEVWWIA